MKLTYRKIYALLIVLIVLIAGAGIFGSSLVVKSQTQTALGDNDSTDDTDLTVVGFSQPGAESAWRVALTESVKNAFTEEKGYKLIYKDGQSKQDNQIKDIRTFIQQGVDYIILSPIVEDGWDQVLEEARDAGIPVIICDRNVTVSNESLYTAFAGSNFREEGQTAIACVEKILKERDDYQADDSAEGSDTSYVLAQDISGNGEADADAEKLTYGDGDTGPQNVQDTETSEEINENADEHDEQDTDGSSEEPDSEKGSSDENPDESEDSGETIDEATDEGEAAEEDGTDETVWDELSDDGEDYFNIVHIQGTIGSSAQVGRTKALEEAVEAHSNWRIIAQECGDFTKGKAREEMTNILNEIDGRQIDMIYCENDEEAFGAMAALNEAGLSYGVGGKIMIVSFDGCRNALSMCMSGLINVEVECNPIQGDYLCNIVSQLQRDMVVPKIAYIDESYFTPDTLTQEFIDSRTY